MRVNLLILSVLILAAVPSAAQPTPRPDVPTQDSIPYNAVAEDSITETAVFDLWTFEGDAGDEIEATMQGFGGLAPLLGIRGGVGDIIKRSDENLEDAPPNGTALLRLTLPEDGSYTLVATRVGTNDGDTTGTYALQLRLLEEAEADRSAFLQPVTFRCNADEATTAASFIINDSSQNTFYEVSVFGLDGFLPIMQFGNREESLCYEQYDTVEAQITHPLDGRISGEVQRLDSILFADTHADEFDRISIVLGSKDGQAGRFVVVLRGPELLPDTDHHSYFLRSGALAQDSELMLYMLRGGLSRLDPELSLTAPGQGSGITCDDAGRRECGDMPGVDGLTLIDADGLHTAGHMLDAGIRVTPTDSDPIAVLATSTNSAGGTYYLLLTGQLPARAE